MCVLEERLDSNYLCFVYEAEEYRLSRSPSLMSHHLKKSFQKAYPGVYMGELSVIAGENRLFYLLLLVENVVDKEFSPASVLSCESGIHGYHFFFQKKKCMNESEKELLLNSPFLVSDTNNTLPSLSTQKPYQKVSEMGEEKEERCLIFLYQIEGVSNLHRFISQGGFVFFLSEMKKSFEKYFKVDYPPTYIPNSLNKLFICLRFKSDLSVPYLPKCISFGGCVFSLKESKIWDQDQLNTFYQDLEEESKDLEKESKDLEKEERRKEVLKEKRIPLPTVEKIHTFIRKEVFKNQEESIFSMRSAEKILHLLLSEADKIFPSVFFRLDYLTLEFSEVESVICTLRKLDLPSETDFYTLLSTGQLYPTENVDNIFRVIIHPCENKYFVRFPKSVATFVFYQLFY